MSSTLSKRIGISFSVLAFAAFAENLINNFQAVGSFEGLGMHYVTLVVGILFLGTCFFSVGKYFQVVCLWVTCLLTIFDDPESGYGLLQIVIIALLMYKYGFIQKNFILKIALSLVLIFGTMFFSTYIRGLSMIHTISTIFFFTLFFFLVFIVLSDEIRMNLKTERRLKEKIHHLNTSLEDTKEHLKKIGADYIDPVEAGLTKAELVLLENLCTYRESNIDLGERLGKSPNTIKVQLTKVMEKIGAETRYQLIDLCKNYYLGNEPVLV